MLTETTASVAVQAVALEVPEVDAVAEVVTTVSNLESPCVIHAGKKAIRTQVVPSQKSEVIKELKLSNKILDNTLLSDEDLLPNDFDPFDILLSNLPSPTTVKDINHLKFLVNVQSQLQASGYDKADSIHSPQGIYFYKHILKAPAFVIGILEKGYKPDVISELNLPYCEANNASAINEMSFVR